MSRPRARALVLLVVLIGCKEGDVDLGDADVIDSDSSTPDPDGGAAGSSAPDAGTGDADVPDPDAGSGPEPPAGLAAVPGELAAATCDALADCVGHAALLSELLGGRDCEELNASALRNGELSYLPDSIESGRVLFDASQLDECAADIRARGCDARSTRWPASCKLMLLGTVDDGGDCSIDQDCAGDAYCFSEGQCPGTCSALLAADEPCTNSDDDQCEDGLVCARATGTCVALGEATDACGADEPACAPGYVCFDDGSGVACTALPVVYAGAVDESCNPGTGGCDPGVNVCGGADLCEPGLVCESQASGGACRPVSARGGTCRRAVPNQCPIDQVCDATAAGMDGSCVDRPVDGEPCIDRDPPCAPGYACVADTCVELQDLGGACESDAECYSETCGTDSTCLGIAVCSVP